MVRKIVSALVLVPLAILIVLFAVANRGDVVLSLDPFSADSPALTLRSPLFLALLVALILGVVIGGCAAWLRQAKWRRMARRLERELSATRSEADDLRRRLAAAEAVPPPARTETIPSIAYRRPPAA